MIDDTETIRREMLAEQRAAGAQARADLEARYGQVWDTAEMTTEFRVHAFMAPVVIVTRLSDGRKGSLEFQHQPRFYYGWASD